MRVRRGDLQGVGCCGREDSPLGAPRRIPIDNGMCPLAQRLRTTRTGLNRSTRLDSFTNGRLVFEAVRPPPQHSNNQIQPIGRIQLIVGAVTRKKFSCVWPNTANDARTQDLKDRPEHSTGASTPSPQRPAGRNARTPQPPSPYCSKFWRLAPDNWRFSPLLFLVPKCNCLAVADTYLLNTALRDRPRQKLAHEMQQGSDREGSEKGEPK